jgi:hypothetical protein
MSTTNSEKPYPYQENILETGEKIEFTSISHICFFFKNLQVLFSKSGRILEFEFFWYELTEAAGKV